jgi:two-component sensor histidine kinase
VLGDHKQSLRYAIASIDLNRKASDTSRIVTFYYRLAEIYFALCYYEKAFFFYGKALSSYDQARIDILTKITTNILARMTDCLIKQQKYREAFEFFSQQLKTYPPFDIVSQDLVNRTYLNLYYYTGHYKKAAEYLPKALQGIHNIIYTASMQVEVLTKAGQLYFQLKLFEKAGKYCDSAFKLALRLNSWPDLMENSLTFYKLDSIKGNYLSAIRHYQEYKSFSDSIQKDVAGKQTAELAVQYETDQKNNELQLLNNKSQLQHEAIQQGKFVRNTMIAGSGLLLLLLFVAFNRYRIKQKANKLLQEKQDEINSQNLVLEKMVQEEKKITAEKDRLLTEKEWLMKEINHRVKNNLQVVMSLLNTQSAYLKDEAALNAIQESRHQVYAISLIHRKLYQTDHLRPVIEMAAYIKEVTEYLADSLDTDHRIRFGLDIAPVELDVTQAVPTGLIINEAVTNAVKYAFPGGGNGQINIGMRKTITGRIELSISDNGIGLPNDFDWQHTESLGMSLMRGLCKQLDGEFEVLPTNGLTIKITFEPDKTLNQ